MKFNKKTFLFVLFVFILAAASFAGESNSSTKATTEMATRVNAIVDFFSSGWVKGICCILLIGECLGLLFAGGQNPQIFKKFLPFIIGTVLFMCAGKIIAVVFGDWGSSGNNFSSDLGTGTSSLMLDANYA